MQRIELVLTEVARRWREQSLAFGPGATLLQVREFEARFRVTFPEDFASYLITLGGMPDGTWDEHQIRFWPLTEIRPIAEAATSPLETGYFTFADYSISAHEYALHLGAPADRHVAIVGAGEPRVLAPTFGEFLSLYIDNATALF
jgi:hypothetical protein